jgi:protein involved in polysaccharide export with SLBB domain
MRSTFVARIVRAVLPVFLMAVGAAAQNSSPNPERAFVKPGDVIKLYVWREEDMSQEFLVQASGRVVLPRIGEIDVVHMPKPALRDSIIAALRLTLNNPSIEVTFLKRINVLGAVRKAGVYNVDETMTIATVLALAEGAEPHGKPDQVELQRGDQTIRSNITRRERVDDLALESGDQLFVPEKSWIARNSPIVAATLLSGVVSVAIALLVRN